MVGTEDILHVEVLYDLACSSDVVLVIVRENEVVNGLALPLLEEIDNLLAVAALTAVDDYGAVLGQEHH